MTSLLSGGDRAPESGDMDRMRARGSEALPREALEVSLSIWGRLPHAVGCLEAQGCRKHPAQGQPAFQRPEAQEGPCTIRVPQPYA